MLSVRESYGHMDTSGVSAAVFVISSIGDGIALCVPLPPTTDVGQVEGGEMCHDRDDPGTL